MRRIIILAMVLMSAILGDAGWAADVLPVNQFAVDVNGQLRSDGNLIWSPVSVFEAMSTTGQGARGNTAKQMARFDAGKSGVGKLIAGLEALDPDFQLHIANAVWAQSGFTILPAFQKALLENYHCLCSNIDFTNPSAASRRINDWVSDQTQGKIADLFSAESLPADAKLVLTNAIYFHADWAQHFDISRRRDFHLANQPNPVQRLMMQENGSFPIAHEDQLDALELPYKGGKIAMLILLPRSNDGLDAMESGLSGDMLNRVISELKMQSVDVAVPKFAFTWQANLSSALEAIGVRAPFNSGEADFSGISPDTRLFLSAVMHKAFIAVDEAGTEAAAATGAIMRPTMVPYAATKFIADHPFFFIIRDRGSGAILFAGRVVDPGSAG